MLSTASPLTVYLVGYIAWIPILDALSSSARFSALICDQRQHSIAESVSQFADFYSSIQSILANLWLLHLISSLLLPSQTKCSISTCIVVQPAVLVAPLSSKWARFTFWSKVAFWKGERQIRMKFVWYPWHNDRCKRRASHSENELPAVKIEKAFYAVTSISATAVSLWNSNTVAGPN